MSKTSVVTKERFISGLSYQNYMAQIKVNKENFLNFYTSAQLSPEESDFFKQAAQIRGGLGKILVIGEDWCPDVTRGLPIAVRIAEAAGVEVRIFPRDTNMDIMNEFLNRGEFASIPVIVFYTNDLTEICHWIERPEIANRDMSQIRDQIQKEMPNASEQEFRNALRLGMTGKYPEWQKESVREMRKMLSDKLKIK
jgi:hypothetical protein